jgi:hypothetical protein
MRASQAKIIRMIVLVTRKLLQPRPCFKQGFLADILSVGHVPGHAPRTLVHRRQVGRNHLRKGVTVPLPRLRQQTGFSAHPAVQLRKAEARKCQRCGAHLTALKRRPTATAQRM